MLRGHGAKAASIDYEGGERAPIRRRPSNIISQATEEVYEEPDTSVFFTPTLQLPPSPIPAWTTAPPHPGTHLPTRPDSPPINHFSTLPPSPPRSGPPTPPRFIEDHNPTAADSWIPTPTTRTIFPNTPPSSAPGSALLGGSFQMNHKLPSANDGGLFPELDDATAPGAGSREGVSLLSPQRERVKRRPSLILTTAPSLTPLGPDAQPLPSPRLRRSYPNEPSAISTSAPSPTFSSPMNSPTLGGGMPVYLSPTFPPPVSPTLSSASMERAPSSPLLGTFTGLAQGLVRRASSSSLNSDALPTSHNPSPTASPNLSTVSLSPLLGSSGGRRGSYAAQAREKEKEREKEERDKERKAKLAAKKHYRMFSWAERPSDDVMSEKGTKYAGIKFAVLWMLFMVAMIGLAGLHLGRRAGLEHAQAVNSQQAARARTTIHARRRAYRRGANAQQGSGDFIHPDVLNRRPVVKKSVLGAPMRWVMSFLAPTPEPMPLHYRPSKPLTSTPTTQKKPAPPGKPVQKKSNNLFVPSKPVPFLDSHALPPPPVHSDAPQRDTLVLYRILGNDLPPRHSPGQTLRNLRFLLEHESDFSTLPHLGPHTVHHAHSYGSGSRPKESHSEGGGLRVDKYFVLNRISEPEVVSAIIGLLKRYSVPESRILVIPFSWKEYEQKDYRWDGGVDEAGGWGVGNKTLDEPLFQMSAEEMAGEGDFDSRRKSAETLRRLRALDYTYHEKNLYAMNNNGGRNFALAHGRSLPAARWILPLDGNSFFTPAAMYSIVSTLSIAGEGDHASRYLVMPMARLLSNEAIIPNNSIALVPHHTQHHIVGASAKEEAERHHRPLNAPESPEEPQIGFRYDSTETYQEAMRYGRRSKLELLWRLGAIPYARGLDKRTLPWESSDRDHVTRDSWGSIPGVDGADRDSKAHAPHHHGDFVSWTDADPERGPLAFVKAGWVYRLFSGDSRQEQTSSESIALRNTNRIKGIAAFIERIDERVARGFAECGADNGACGFSSDRLWNFDSTDVERTRQKYKYSIEEVSGTVDAFEEEVYQIHASVRLHFQSPNELASVDPKVAANNATILAMAGYLTGNASYSGLAADLITARFVRQVPLFYKANQLRQKHLAMKDGKSEDDRAAAVAEFDGLGYGFPPPLTGELATGVAWGTTADHHLTGAELPSLPFDPLSFDPSPLLDAVRLLKSPNAPRSDLSHPTNQKTVENIFLSHLSYLLFNPKAIALSNSPSTAREGADFDAKVAALAAYLNDARLFVRVANRARLRLRPQHRAEGLLAKAEDVTETHWRLAQGIARTKLLPWSLGVDAIPQSDYIDRMFGEESPLHLLGF
ncbi:hypothetical protein MNV49_003480 [Pseudohyphozyma bogoriensis]|nr:hypothetical protein MNV49_003480 [Pseudohyphozyma bogoriensis]